MIRPVAESSRPRGVRGGAWDHATATHLLRRVGFGASRERVQRAREAGLDATLATLFEQREHDPDLRAGVESLLGLGRVEPLQAWWMSLILGNRAPLVERVTLMWHDHFATSFDKVDDARLMHRQLELLREHGLGDFRELLHAVARDPAMLLWLDGNDNRVGAPNENFAREVMELFALGIGNYTEHDVSEAARALTGWGVDRRRFVFRREHHDRGTKEIFGRAGTFGPEEALELVLDHPACPRHVARTLLAEFVHPEPTRAEVEEWSRVLVACDWNVGRTLERLLAAPLMRSDRARRARITGPVELVASTALALGARPAPTDAAHAAATMGQALFQPPSVKGWDGGRTWIHAGNWLARSNYLTQLAYAHGREGTGIRVDLFSALGRPDRADVARAALDLLLPDTSDRRLRKTLERAAEEAPNFDEALRRVVALVLTAPEYHLT